MEAEKTEAEKTDAEKVLEYKARIRREEAEKQNPGGQGLGHLTIDDSKIGVVRHPDNAHMDKKA